ncbi:probable hydroxymethylglutaryl-CoA lyase, mitochondrial precursor [Phialocephala subalpina]|uniref:hydroxymethylglutaryl-CoA lyase n=1 Tax=Phialocephala subalpina TaxID=576137 RepID=A0A1L7WIU4_9HELO|nr:probable hydroxymethylglutaryl-CoA lyase, mitochondrial precursor [Phialocephala subalpina]
MQCLRPLARRSCINRRPRHLRAFASAVDPAASHSHQHQATSNYVKIVEVGPRDGLQNEKKTIPLTTKIELIERLARTGLTDIEAGSFVAPKWVPQMADSNEILEYILKYPPTSLNPIAYSFLAPNARGLDNALSILRANPKSYQAFSEQSSPYEPDESNISNESASDSNTAPPFVEMSVFAAATESFSQKNLNCSVDKSLERFKDVIVGAKAMGLRVKAYISVVLGCPFEGYDVDPRRVAEIACDLMEMGADEIDLGDTTGMGTAPRTGELLRAMQAAGIRNEDLTMHFHDTYGQALVNTAVSLEHGIRRFDASVGGLGGCPYSPGATGNVSTEDLVYFMESLGMETGLDLNALSDIGDWITKEIGKPNSSSVGKALLGKRLAEDMKHASKL